ncbi:MAG: hypothetical protein GY829_01925 [Gammaproteobacteria bacterium]|nr:hypothetical protein [Gammaproteobacteria bacterium]
MMISLFNRLKKQEIIPGLTTDEQALINDYFEEHRPVKQNLIKDTQLIAIDFETTGLDPSKDEIISMGFCPIYNGVIRLADCLHIVLKTENTLTSENVAIHGLMDDALEQGVSQKQALFKFIELTQSKVIVAHFHNIEKDFIQKLAKQILGKPLPLSFIDSFEFAKRRMQKKQQIIKPNSLRLFNLRKYHGLPNYKAHNALEDAISTAELHMSQTASLDLEADKIRFKDIGLFNYKS